MCFRYGSLHCCCVDGGNIGRAKVSVGEANSTVNSEKVT